MSENNLEIYKETLRNNNLKVTPVRLELLAILDAKCCPMDVEALRKKLANKKIVCDEATVYRNVKKFTELGLLREINFNDGKLRYEKASQAHHHHFVCTKCNTIIKIDLCELDEVQQKLEKKHAIKIKSHNLEFFGHCGQCVTS